MILGTEASEIGQAFGAGFGDEFSGSSSLAENALEGCGCLSGKCLTCRYVAEIGEASS
jgi:hypothetical protein